MLGRWSAVKVAGITSEVHAEKRMALLMGIETFAGEIGRLVNPHYDVAMLEKLFKGLSPGENEDEPPLASEASADNRSVQLAVRLRSLARVQPEIRKLIASGALPICPSTLGGGNSL
jgi:hypothetical protein